MVVSSGLPIVLPRLPLPRKCALRAGVAARVHEEQHAELLRLRPEDVITRVAEGSLSPGDDAGRNAAALEAADA